MPTAPYLLEQAESDIGDLRGLVDRLQEVHALDGSGGVVPNAQPGQAQLYTTSDGQPAYVNPAGLTMNHSGGQLAAVAPVVVTAASATTIASLFVPGNDCIPGAIYRLTTFGFGTTGTTGASNVLTCNLQLGGVGGGAASAGSSLFGVSQAFRFYIEASLVCITNGAGATFYSYASWSLAQSGSNILPTGVQAVGIALGTSSTFSADSTTGETFRIQLNWAATTGAPTVTAVSSFGERVA